MPILQKVFSDKVKGKITDSCPDCKYAVYIISTGYIYQRDIGDWDIEFLCDNGEILYIYSKDYEPLIKLALSEQNIDY